MTEQKKRKFFELTNGLNAVDYRNKDYYDRIDDHEKSLYSPYMLMRYVSATTSAIPKIFREHYIDSINENVNKHLWTISGKHKKLCWILTASCGVKVPDVIAWMKRNNIPERIFHPWIKPMKRVPNNSLKQLLILFPNTKEADLETLDAIITDRELEELLESHGIESK